MTLPRNSILFVCYLIIFTCNVNAVDISNPLNLLFAADRQENFIDVIDLHKQESVYQIQTKYKADDLVATPYAPLLFYTSIEDKLISVYNLEEKQHIKDIQLPVAPQHIVLDTTGTRIGISNSDTGGFVLLSAYAMDIMFSLEDLTPTTDVLFDPNDVDIYYTDNEKGVIGIIDMNTQSTYEMLLGEKVAASNFSSPSRNLDGQYIYVTNYDTGEIYSLNAYSRKIYHRFSVGDSPVRPYSTPEGWFLYLMDSVSGQFISIEQGNFNEYTNLSFDKGINLVSVGRFDRLNLFLSNNNRHYYLYDNLTKELVKSGEFNGTPVNAFGSVDGTRSFVAFRDSPEIAIFNLETQEVSYISATKNGTGAYKIGLSNQVCH